jgi:EAL domain-containing protein (putative c-di-GMP-specific phosphodiesterase class I)
MPSTAQPGSLDALPYLEYYPAPSGLPQRVALRCFPFSIGRDSAAHLVIPSRRVSQTHAVITREGEGCYICDLHSTNGTFVNGQRVEANVPLQEGDIVHLADMEFRFAYALGTRSDESPMTTEMGDALSPLSFIRVQEYLVKLISGRLATAYFQPIVQLADRRVIGYESLARGRHDALPDNPAQLLDLASRSGLATELSDMFRKQALVEADRLPTDTLLFLNLHPEEVRSGTLLRSLAEIPAAVRAARPLVVEVHEDVVTGAQSLQQLRDDLRDLGIRLAYDDFGAGQTRLAELAAVPPDFVKLDRKVVQDLPYSRPLQELVRTLGQVSERLNCEVIAEGVETEAEAETCLHLGCRLAQGYLFGRPQNAIDLMAPRSAKTAQIPRIA